MKKRRNSFAMILVTLLLIFSAYLYYEKYFYILKDPNRIKTMIMSYGKYSIIAFLLLQIIQVVAFFIPGEIIQIAGGYIYGTFWGSILSALGITVGSIFTYFISNKLGKPFIEKITTNEKVNHIQKIISKCSSNYIIFFIYLIPGLPKDVVGYVCGASNVEFRNFIIYSTLGRLPCIFVSAYFGNRINSGDMITLIVIGVIMLILFFIGVLKGEKLITHITSKK